jgi:hypothetical protein
LASKRGPSGRFYFSKEALKANFCLRWPRLWHNLGSEGTNSINHNGRAFLHERGLMKKIIKASVIIMVIFSCLVISQNDCLSAKWMHVTNGVDGLKVYVDYDSIYVNSKKKQIILWSKYVESDGSYLLCYDLINYKEKNNTTLEYIKYDHLGKVIQSGRNVRQIYMVPGTVYEALFNFVLEIKGLK